MNRELPKFSANLISMIYALYIWIRVRQLRTTNLSEDWHPAGSAIMFDPLARIQRSSFTPISFLPKSEWNRLDNFPDSDLKFSSEEVFDVDDKGGIPYIQKFIFATSTNSRLQRYPPNSTQSSKTMYICTLSRYWRRFFIGFTLGVLAIVAKEPMVDGRRPE